MLGNSLGTKTGHQVALHARGYVGFFSSSSFFCFCCLDPIDGPDDFHFAVVSLTMNRLLIPRYPPGNGAIGLLHHHLGHENSESMPARVFGSPFIQIPPSLLSPFLTVGIRHEMMNFFLDLREMASGVQAKQLTQSGVHFLQPDITFPRGAFRFFIA